MFKKLFEFPGKALLFGKQLFVVFYVQKSDIELLVFLFGLKMFDYAIFLFSLFVNFAAQKQKA